MTGFIVVRQRTVPLRHSLFYCISLGFYRCPPTHSSFGETLLLYHTRIYRCQSHRQDAARHPLSLYAIGLHYIYQSIRHNSPHNAYKGMGSCENVLPKSIPSMLLKSKRHFSHSISMVDSRNIRYNSQHILKDRSMYPYRIRFVQKFGWKRKLKMLEYERGRVRGYLKKKPRELWEKECQKQFGEERDIERVEMYVKNVRKWMMFPQSCHLSCYVVKIGCRIAAIGQLQPHSRQTVATVTGRMRLMHK